MDDPRGLLESSYSAVKTFFKNEPFLKVWQEGGASTALGTTGKWALNGSMLVENRELQIFRILRMLHVLTVTTLVTTGSKSKMENMRAETAWRPHDIHDRCSS